MQYIKIDNNTLIEFDALTDRSLVLKMDVLQQSADAALGRLANIPNEPSDEELLEWAKANFPRVDYSVERATLQQAIARRDEIETIMAGL